MSDFDLSAQLATALQNDSSFIPLSLSFLAGLLSSLSPCVYPLIPITLSVMGARRYDSRIIGFLVASCYVLGMALVYTLLGALSAYLGLITGGLMQNALVLLSIAVIFFLFALAMFGIVTIVIPTRLLNKLSSIGGNGFRGAFIMGLVAGVVAAPCTGPVLGFILTLIAREQNLGLGFALMGSFSLGLGLPFLCLATFSSLLMHLPKSGPWMDKIKLSIGALMMGAAFYYVGLAIPHFKKILNVFNQLGGLALFINLFLGTFLLLVEPRFVHRSVSRILPKIMGACLIAISIASLLSYENKTKTHIASHEINWHVINDQSTTKDFDALLLEAKKNHRKVLIDFYADWCVACIQLSNTTLKDPAVLLALKDFILIKIDASSSSTHINGIQQRYNVVGLPTLIFLDENGGQNPRGTIMGFLNASAFLKRVDEL